VDRRERDAFAGVTCVPPLNSVISQTSASVGATLKSPSTANGLRADNNVPSAW